MSSAAPTSPTGRPMRADALRNRAKLLTAAREVFAERPHDASMDDVAKRAGVGAGTLFRNFPKRIDLVQALYEEDLTALEELSLELRRTASPWDALAQWLRAFAEFSQAKRTIFAEVAQAFERDPDAGARTRERIDGSIERLLVPARDQGLVDPDLTPHDLVQLVGGVALSIVADDTRTEYLMTRILRGITAG